MICHFYINIMYTRNCKDRTEFVRSWKNNGEIQIKRER